MKEWNAIDLHMHTLEGVTRDKTSDNVNFTYEKFIKVIIKHNLKLIAITNHNIINFPHYILARHLAKNVGTNVLMGVELDTSLSTGKPLHIACIFEEKFKKNYIASEEINQKTTIKKDDKTNSKIVYDDNDIVELLKKYNLLMIPHGDKDKGLFKNASNEQIEESLKKIREGFIRIFDGNSNWKLEQIKQYLSNIKEENLDDFGGVLFSDIRDWDNYDDKFRNFYMNSESTFRGLIHSISNPTKRFKKFDEIQTNSNYISKIVFKNKNPDGKIFGEIKLSSDYNCIIGKSGSGKSLLLYLLKENLLKKNDDKKPEDDKNYSFAKDTLCEFYNEDNLLLDNEKIKLNVGASLFMEIIRASSQGNTKDFYNIIKLINDNFQKLEKFNQFKNEYNKKIESYFNYEKLVKEKHITLKDNLINFLTYTKKMNELSKIKIFDVKPINSDIKKTYKGDEIENYINSQEQLLELINDISNYKGKYKNELTKISTDFSKLMKKIILDINNTDSEENIRIKKIGIINDSIFKINSTISSKSSEKSKLSISIPKLVIEIAEIVINISMLKKQKDSVDLSIKIDDLNSIKEINKKKDIVVKEIVDSEKITQVNERENDLFNTYSKKSYLSATEAYDFTKDYQAKSLIDKYIELGIINDTNKVLNGVLEPEVSVLFDNQDVRELNPGNISKKYIEEYFEEKVKTSDFNTVLFDQIENDVDKEFISSIIKDQISDTKGKVQLIIVTHDPIVAVNADPNNYIESKYENGSFTYRNFVAESSINDELLTIASNVDGSKDVIRKRYEIYEGDKKYEN